MSATRMAMWNAVNDLAACFGTTTVKQRSGFHRFHPTSDSSSDLARVAGRPTQLTDPTSSVYCCSWTQSASRGLKLTVPRRVVQRLPFGPRT
jgi:hypothetical protein